MKIKQYLPIIVIFLFSCVFALGATSYLFFSSKYPEDITARLMLNLRQGVVVGIILLVLLSMGWGLHALLARIQDVSRRKLFSLGIYLGSFVLCIVLPGIVIISTYFVFSQQEGWQELPTVTAPAVQIAAAGDDSVTVQGDDGNYYYCWTIQLERCWEITDEPSSPLLQDYEGELKATENPPGVTPPDDVIDIVGISYNNSAIFLESHYAVTSDGQVWYLNRETNNGTAAFATGFMFIFTMPIILGTATILLGVGISEGTRRVANRIWREADKTEEQAEN